MPKPSATPLAQALRGPPAPPDPIADAPDELARARATVLLVMDGQGGRNASARLRAAELVLGKVVLEGLSDEDLLAEVKRRADARTAR